MERDHVYVYRKASANAYFHSWWFEKRCFANLFLILAGSWWVDGRQKGRGLYFIARALLAYPPVFRKLLRKMWRR
jgi:hypothetical protein